MTKIEISITDLQELLNDQKKAVGEYITRNLSTYIWFEGNVFDITAAKDQLKSEVNKAGYPNDFYVLKKYIKP